MMRVLRLSLRFIRREWHSGELTTAALALVIAVASVSAVGFFTDRVRGAMSQQASELLAADLLVVSSQPIPAAWTKQAANNGLNTALVTQFPSVVLAGSKTLLAEVKAVTPSYPLRGEVRRAEPGVRGIPR